MSYRRVNRIACARRPNDSRRSLCRACAAKQLHCLFVSGAADLPDDIDALKAALREARATIADRDIGLQERDSERHAAREDALSAQTALEAGSCRD